jgi:hypothetical protein
MIKNYSFITGLSVFGLPIIIGDIYREYRAKRTIKYKT